MSSKKLLLTAAGATIASTTVLAFPSTASTQNFDEIYVFGDSLSDVGNVFKATHSENPQSPPYFEGRYTNGPVWVEYLASKLKLSANPKTNFAYGGATTGNSTELPPGLLAQIEKFKATHSSADPKALYIIWAGANDYLGGTTDTIAPVRNLATAVTSLAAVGAKNILVVNLPDLGKLPGTRTTEGSDALNNLTKKHNSELAASLKSLPQQLSSDINIKYLDVNSVFNQVISNPRKFGFANVTNPCLNQATICNNPNEYLFWDSIHPTTAAHKLFVELAFSTLKSESNRQTRSAYPPILPIALGVIVFGALGAGILAYSQR